MSYEFAQNTEAKTLQHYKDSADILCMAAHTGFGLEVSKETHDRWTSAMALLYHLDAVFDKKDQGDSNRVLGFIERLYCNPLEIADGNVRAVGPELEAEAVSLRQRISLEESSLFFRKGLQLLRAEERSKVTTDPVEYAQISRLSGQISMGMLLSLTDGQDKAKSKYPAFVKLANRLARARSVQDEAFDLKEDYADGRSRVMPTFVNRLRILNVGKADFGYITKELGLDVLRFSKPIFESIIKRQHVSEPRAEVVATGLVSESV